MAEQAKKATAADKPPSHPAVQGGEGGPQAGKKDPQVAATSGEASKLRTAEPAGSADAGPGTGKDAPQDTLQRGQARMHTGSERQAAPIEAPDAARQTDPIEGHSRSSTNPVAAGTGLRTIAGENHVRYVDEDGKDLSADEMFEDQDPTKTFRIAKKRVYEEFNYQGSDQPMTRLLFPAGHRLDLATAARLAAAHETGVAQAKQEADRLDAERKAFHGAS